MKKVNVKITFLEGILGTSSADAEIYTRFIGAKAPDAATIKEEVEALGAESIVERGTTVFPRDDDGTPFLYDYQIKGFFKDACSMLARLSEKDPETGKKKKAKNESGKLTAYKKVIDGLIFVEPRKICLESPGPVTICQRPLRAQTAQGERVALSSSEELPAGTTVTMTIICMDDSHWAAVEEWLNYGSFRGIGQWRNSGKGRFAWEVLD
ncbi:hypothetical protein B5F17_14075 [Butyricicoccus pullicaecorum]|uniref:Uncharacterized protein n=1 Tax=Butyricicoccus pullicaecorum TaxID=501571 RepID=A0A1Y4L0B3_9FIRM|nr:hypothetical protein [Butyricicoccus pullicaecorum]OUP50258.1 hypothetical protein B5F17_14075 [Butyricicoccus pullicaecorum]